MTPIFAFYTKDGATYPTNLPLVNKIIANRLKPLMKDVVGEWQSSFIPGRQTVDNVVVVQEILTTFGTQEKRQEG